MKVVCDIDGCLADVVMHVEAYLVGEPKNWKSYFACTSEFPPIKPMIMLVNALIAEGHDVAFVSGRPESNRVMTEYWLRTHLELIRDDKLLLFLRRDGDGRTNSEIKLEVYRSFSEGAPLLVIDDEPTTIGAAAKEGFIPLQVVGFRATKNDQIPPKEY